MVHQTKHRAWVSRYALSAAALIALGTTSLSALPTAAKAQAVTSPSVCHSNDDGKDDSNLCPAPAPAPAPPQAQQTQPTPPDPKNQAQNRLQ
jgi:hypothetical protein